MKPVRSINSAMQRRSRLSLAISLALLAAIGFAINTGHAIAPGITEVDQTFKEHTAVPDTDRPIMAATVVAGLFLFTTNEEFCGTQALRLAGDPDRVLTVNGNPIPPEGYELLRSEAGTLFDKATGFCSTPNPAFTSSRIDLSFNVAAGATDLGGGKTRIAIAMIRFEGGCAFINQLGGPLCIPGVGATDLNGNGDIFDDVLQYMLLELNTATKNVTVGPVMNTGLQAEGGSLSTDGTTIASFVTEGSISQWACSPAGGGFLNCFPDPTPGEDLDGDGIPNANIPASPARVLRLYNVVTGVARNTRLSHQLLGGCPAGSSLFNEFTPGPAQTVRMGNGIVAFESDEVAPQPEVNIPGPSGGASLFCPAKPGRAFNNDGDFVDRVIRFFHVDDPVDANGRQTVRLGPVLADRTPGFGGFVQDMPRGVGLLGTDGMSIAYVVQESGPFASFPPCPDLTGDCDQGDNALQVYDIASGAITNSGAAVSEGLLIPGPRDAFVANGVVAFVTMESAQGFPPGPPPISMRDYNGDGDSQDTILRLFDIANKRVINTNIALMNRDGSGNPVPGVPDAFAIGTDGAMAGFVLPITFPIPAPPFTSTAPGSIHYIKFAAPPAPADTTPPMTSTTPSHAPNANGWNNTDVTVSLNATDNAGGSGVKEIHFSLAGAMIGGGVVSGGLASVTISAEGITTLAYFAKDNAGNQEAQKTLTVSIDKTPPGITITSPANGGTYVLNEAVVSSYSCSDATSGVATCTGPVPSGANFSTGTVGSNRFTVNASDVAGNTASATTTYSVVYNFSGFLSPLSSASFSGVFKLGRTIPIKWQLTDANGFFITTAVPVTTLRLDSVMCTGEGDATEPFDPGTSGSTSLRYDSSSNQYIFNWQTTGLAAGCYNILMNPGDGLSRVTRIQLKP